MTPRRSVRRAGGRSRPRALGLVLGGLAGVALAAGLFGPRPGGSPGTDTVQDAATDEVAAEGRDPALLAQLDAYEATMAGPIEDAAFVVVNGLKPGVEDVFAGAYPDDALITMAEGWLASLEAARDGVAAVDVPAPLAEVAAAHDDAMASYVQAAETLLAAARANGSERADLVHRAADLGESADDAFDRAQAELDRLRSHAGGTNQTADTPISSSPEEDR